MLILVKRALTFARGNDGTSFTARLTNNHPEEAPDWIRETETFKAAVKDGNIFEVRPATELAADEALPTEGTAWRPSIPRRTTEDMSTGASPDIPEPKILRITGPDDCYFVIEPFTEGYTWRLLNDGLLAVRKLQPSIAAVQSFHAGKGAFRESESCNAQMPQILELKPGHRSDSKILATFDGDKLQLGELHHHGSLRWPSGDENPEQRWLVHLRVAGLSTDWLFDVELEWTFGTKRFTVTHIKQPVIGNPQDRVSQFGQEQVPERVPPNPKTSSLVGQGMPWDPAALSPGREFPRFIYHPTEPPKMVSSVQEEAELGPDWSRTYIHQNYPAWRYHWTKKELVVKSAEEDAALGGGWTGSPAEFTAYGGPRPPKSEESDPLRWAGSWPFPGLSPVLLKRIEAKVLRADSAFWTAPDSEGAESAAMKLAFSGIAEVLFTAGVLTEQLLRNELRTIVWDSAIAGGWYRFASENPSRIFPEQLGHYYVWRDEAKGLNGLFRAEIADWLATLRESASEAPVPSTEGSVARKSVLDEQPSDHAAGSPAQQNIVETLEGSTTQKPSEAQPGTPEDRLFHFVRAHPGTTYADIKYSADVHSAEFQDWRKQKLKPTSVMSERIEKVLNGITPLQKKPPKPRAD